MIIKIKPEEYSWHSECYKLRMFFKVYQFFKHFGSLLDRTVKTHHKGSNINIKFIPAIFISNINDSTNASEEMKDDFSTREILDLIFFLRIGRFHKIP